MSRPDNEIGTHAGARVNVASGSQQSALSRYLVCRGQWFVLLPDGVTLGPFATRRAAEVEANRNTAPCADGVAEVPFEAPAQLGPVLKGYVVEELSALDGAQLSRLLRLVHTTTKR